jgi:hypothetical protein
MKNRTRFFLDQQDQVDVFKRAHTFILMKNNVKEINAEDRQYTQEVPTNLVLRMKRK